MAGPDRIELAPRRLTVTDTIEWGKNTWLLSVGFRWGHVREVFINGIKVGTDADAWAVDSCILLSRLLQSGWEAAALLASLSPMPEQASSATPSLMAVILHKAIELEAQEGAEMRRTQGDAAMLDPWRRVAATETRP
jgi:hypothetical protein